MLAKYQDLTVLISTDLKPEYEISAVNDIQDTSSAKLQDLDLLNDVNEQELQDPTTHKLLEGVLGRYLPLVSTHQPMPTFPPLPSRFEEHKELYYHNRYIKVC